MREPYHRTFGRAGGRVRPAGAGRARRFVLRGGGALLLGALVLASSPSRAAFDSATSREKAADLLRETVEAVTENYVTLPDLKKVYAAGLEGMRLAAGGGRLEVTRKGARHFVLRAGGREHDLRLGAGGDGGIGAFLGAYAFVADRAAPAKAADPELEVMYRALERMVSSLDPFSAFMRPDAFRQMKVETRGHYGGIGVTISIQKGRLIVVSPIEDTPAFLAGFRPDDEIAAIDGEPTRGMSLAQIVRRMRGPPGTEVKLLIRRKGWPAPRPFVLTRADIRIRSVKSRVREGGIGYLRIAAFHEGTTRELDRELGRLRAANVRGLVLDLRNNPGGLLHKSVQVAERFLPEGSMVVFTRGRHRSQTLSFRTRTDGEWVDPPMVVLINRGSASASEIVAGALQDLDRALLIGRKSFGKASVQTVIPLSHDAGLRLTTAKYYTPLGREIHGKGIHPDIELDKRTGGKDLAPISVGGKYAGGKDPALSLALAILRDTSGADIEALRQAALRVRARRMERIPKAEVPVPGR